MGSGWFIEDIELEDAPTADNRNITRTFQSQTLFNFFPQLTKSSAQSSDYSFSGIVYPQSKIFALDQIAASADTETVIVKIPDAEKLFPANKFTIKSLVLDRKGPLFVVTENGTIPAVKFTLIVTQLPDEGEFTEGADGFKEGEEGGLGLTFLEELTEKFKESIGDAFGPFEVFQNPDLGLIIAKPPVEAAI